jgi:hypothetical protein
MQLLLAGGILAALAAPHRRWVPRSTRIT